MAAAAIFNFEKNVNNFGLDKDMLHQIIWKDAPRRRGDDHVTKSRNRKLIKYHTINTLEKPNSHKLKIQDGGGRHLKFRKKSQ